MADRGAFILVRASQTGTDDEGEDLYMYIVACWTVFFTKTAAHRKLTTLIEEEAQDLDGAVFTWDTHRVLAFDRRV